MADLIKSQLAEDVAQNIVVQLTRMETDFEPHYINLSNDERSGIRTMAEGREGAVRLVNQIAMAHPDDLRRKDDPLLLDKKLKYDALLEGIRQRTVSFLEMVEETQLANSKDIMAVYDSFVQVLQSARSRDSSLDASMMEIDQINKKFGRPKTDDTPAPPQA